MPKKERAYFLSSHKEEFKNKTFCELFQDTVRLFPEKVAVSGIYGTFTYRELEEKSNILAAHLIRQGMQPREVVGVHAGQSVWSVIFMIGIWKAGGAYVYIDSTHPKKRQRQIIEECKCRFVIDREFAKEIDWSKKEERVDFSELEDMALLIYTSGSTSKPKGVMLSHKNVMCAISNFDRLSLSEEDVYGVFPSFSFVASVFDLYASLAVGASVRIIQKAIRKSITGLLECYIEHGITVTFLPPHMASKLENIEEGKTSLRLLLVGSDMPRNLAASHYEICNVYGASEMTSIISEYRITEPQFVYPIGRLNDTIKGYVVDEEGKQVPYGEEGELWLASDQVSMGYYKDPERTAAYFIENPFSKEEGFTRIFKTKDLVRMDADGIIHYIGRMDFMYKIRGFRVEASAVETAMRCTGIAKECAAVAFEDQGGTNILCGYFEADEEVDVKAFKEVLKESLPYYMIPTALFQMENLPRTLSNKINRKALKPPKELNDHKLLEALY